MPGRLRAEARNGRERPSLDRNKNATCGTLSFLPRRASFGAGQSHPGLRETDGWARRGVMPQASPTLRTEGEAGNHLFTPTLFPEDLDHVLAHTRDDWEELRGQRLFMTGGAGFFGTWLIETFLWANQKLDLGAEIVVLSRDPAALLRKMPHLAGQPGLGFHAGNMCNFDFPPGEFGHVIHAATGNYDSSSALDLLAAFDHDVQGTRRVLDFARQCGAKRVLFTSSGAVYGRQPSDLAHVPEDYAACTVTPNLTSKWSHTQSSIGYPDEGKEHLCLPIIVNSLGPAA